ncbi:MAG: caspase family protein [Bacteroidia bacterium]
MLFLFGLPVLSQIRGVSVNNQKKESNIKGNTYALIVGISKYKDPAIPQLEFADKDAIAFYNFLLSTGVDSNNIFLRINQQARLSEIWSDIYLLNEIAKSGDEVFIYFSGHGDVESRMITKDAFLLPYDSPKSLYAAGAISIYLLKGGIATLSAKGVKVVFIADACHSGTLAGGREGMEAAASVLKDKWQDEIKILSCQPGELSIEGKQWGNGRGLFSYELINGISGLADKNKNGKVSLRELNLFLMEKVPDEASPAIQNPVIMGNMETELATVNKNTLNSVSTLATNQSLTKVDSKGFEESILKNLPDSIQNTYYAFSYLLKNGYLGAKEENSAYYHLKKIPENESTRVLIALMKRNLAAAIIEHAQTQLDSLVNNFKTQEELDVKRLSQETADLREILGDEKVKSLGYLSKSLYFQALEISRTDKDYYLHWWHFSDKVKPIKDKLLYGNQLDSIYRKTFYSGSSMNDSLFVLKDSVLIQAIETMNSALMIDSTAAYLFLAKADLLIQRKRNNEAISLIKMAIKLSPKFYYSKIILGKTYMKMGMNDSALMVFSDLAKSPVIEYSIQANSKKSEVFNLMNEIDSSEYYMKNVINLLANVKLDTVKFSHPIRGMKLINLSDTIRDISYLRNHLELYKLNWYNDCMDSLDSNYFYRVSFEIKKPWQYEVEFEKVGDYFFNRKEFDKALFYYNSSGFQKPIAMKIINVYAEMNLPCIAVNYLEESLEEKQHSGVNLSPYLPDLDFNFLNTNPHFHSIRTTPEFKSLMKKYFPDQYKEK